MKAGETQTETLLLKQYVAGERVDLLMTLSVPLKHSALATVAKE